MSEASEDTIVQIKGTFGVKKRDLNGLNRVAEYMNANRVERVPIAGYVEFVRHVDKVEGDEMTVALVAVEPAIEPDGSDPHGRAARVREIVAASRRSGGKAPVPDTLFTGAETKELDGQLAAITRGEVDTTRGTDSVRSSEAGRQDGDEVPEKSGEEIMAERAEAREKATAGSEARTAAATARVLAVQQENARIGAGVTAAAVLGTTHGATASVGEGNTSKPAKRTPRKATARPAATADPFTTSDTPGF